MKIYCTSCAKNVGEVADAKIPANKTVFIKCPKCETRISIKKELPELKLKMEKIQEEAVEIKPPPRPARNDRQNFSGKHEVDPRRSPAKSYPGHSNSSSALTIVAVTLFITLFLFIGLRFWSFAKVSRLYELGPSRISQNEKSLAIYADNKIYHYQKSGQLNKIINLSKLNLDAPITDIELLADNSVLIGERKTGLIHRCNMDTLTCTDISPTEEFAVKDGFRFLANENAGVLYISDTLNGRLMSQDLDGGDTRIIDSNVSYPNDMVMDEGRLYLCDTFNARVISYKVENNGVLNRISSPFVSLDSFTTPEGLMHLAKKSPEELKAYMQQQTEKIKNTENSGLMIDRPLSLAKDPTGKWWLGLTSEADMFGGEVRVYDSSGKFITKMPDPENGVAEDLMLFNGEIMIADPVLMRVYTVNPTTYAVSDYGGKQLNDDLQSLRTQNSIASLFKKWATRIMMLIGACLLGLLFYIRNQQS